MITRSTILAAAAFASLAALPASAQSAPPVNKTWVSSTGSDTGSCQLASPCKTFAYAISETNAGGEIDVKDSGAYGAFTITKDITVVAAGVVASVGAGANSVAVNIATPGIHVDLVGLTVNTHNKSSVSGIVISCSGCIVALDHMNIQGNKIGINTYGGGRVVLTNSHIDSNDVGIENDDSGLIYIGNNTVSLNNIGLKTSGNGTICSYGNNDVDENILTDIDANPVNCPVH